MQTHCKKYQCITVIFTNAPNAFVPFILVKLWIGWWVLLFGPNNWSICVMCNVQAHVLAIYFRFDKLLYMWLITFNFLSNSNNSFSFYIFKYLLFSISFDSIYRCDFLVSFRFTVSTVQKWKIEHENTKFE